MVDVLRSLFYIKTISSTLYMRINSTLYLLLFLSSNLMLRTGAMIMLTHVKCRGGMYPHSKIERFPVPDSRISWTTAYPDYKPPNYTSPYIYGKPWADPDIGVPDFKPNWNSLDESVNRKSYTGKYRICNDHPYNPIGRTGIAGRGVLGRWGPNHAADPIVTRWKRVNGAIEFDKDSNPILQVVVIKRRDSGEWALPGGMVDPHEHVAAAAVREFHEEATNSLLMTDDEKQFLKLKFERFFSGGDQMYEGYVDDPRNTDNAWMETVAYNFHDDTGETVGGLKLHAGDDAVGVRWVDIVPKLNLYASHKQMVEEVRKKLVNQRVEEK